MLPLELERLHRQGLFSDVALHFAGLLRELDDGADENLLLAACLAVESNLGGHVCIDLREWAGHLPGREVKEFADIATPDIDSWLRVLRASPVVGTPGAFCPLILDTHDRLYLQRYWAYENRLACSLRRMADSRLPVPERRVLASHLDRLFGVLPENQSDWQRAAAVVALSRRLCVISGGPGTGKTSTVARLLALLICCSGAQRLRIGLAAPTGKAAARLHETMHDACEQLPIDRDQLSQIPGEATTIHRLLGYEPESGGFRFGTNQSLALDVLVVDEASMVDLALMARLVDALPESARLVLLGDKDQLASVEAGSVLGDICDGPEDCYSSALDAELEHLCGIRECGSATAATTIGDCIVLLKRSYRFAGDSGIGRLARTVNVGEASAAVEILRSGEGEEVALLDPGQSETEAEMLQVFEEGYVPYLETAEPKQALDAFNRFRVLCALRHGPAGTERINALVESYLAQRGLVDPRQRWYRGRPIIITRNDYSLKLFNGDTGVLLPDTAEDGRMKAFFQDARRGVRSVPPALLPDHETVYAMTVHKSQGSEFERVLMLLPADPSRLVTRELLYTGITRARSGFNLYATEYAISAAVGRRMQRVSGLSEKLWS